MRIGHISDFHLRERLEGTSAVPARRSREVPELLREAVQRLAEARPDFVAVTGDLVDHPHQDMNSPLHRRAGAADLRLVRELLEPLPCPWAALPGNHDHPALFAEVFGPPLVLEASGHRIIAFHDWDTDDPSADPPAAAAAHVPHRRDAERQRFDAILADDDPRPQIHLQHYVITPRLDEGWPHTYADGEALRDALAADGRVRLLLSGHYHPGTEPTLADGTPAAEVADAAHAADGVAGGPWFVVAPAFCQVPHPFLVHDLDDDGRLSTTRIELRPEAA